MLHPFLKLTYTVLELMDESIEIAEFSVRKASCAPTLLKFHAGRLPPRTTLAEYLSKTFLENGFSKRRVHVLIGGGKIRAKSYLCPLEDEAEARSAAMWDEEFYAPFRQGEVYSAFLPLPCGDFAGQTKFFAVMTPRRSMDELLHSLEEISLLPKRLLYAPLEALHLIDEASYTSIDCQTEYNIYSVSENSLCDFIQYSDAADCLAYLRGRSAPLETVVLGGRAAEKESLRAFLRSELPPETLRDIEDYKRVDFSTGLDGGCILPQLSAGLIGAAIKLGCR